MENEKRLADEARTEAEEARALADQEKELVEKEKDELQRELKSTATSPLANWLSTLPKSHVLSRTASRMRTGLLSPRGHEHLQVSLMKMGSLERSLSTKA